MKNILIVGLGVLLLIGMFFIGRSTKTLPKSNDTIAYKIEQVIINNDSLIRVNDSITFKVKEIEKVHEKTVDDIIRNNPITDYQFFSAYIERYCGNYNSDTTQESESNIR